MKFYYIFYRGAWEIHIINYNDKKIFKMLSALINKYNEFLYNGYKIRIYYNTNRQKDFIKKCIKFIKQKWYIMDLLNGFENNNLIIFNYLNFLGSNNNLTNCLEIHRGIDENI